MARMKKEDPFYTKLKDFAAAIEECAVDYEKLIRGYPETEIMIPQMKLHESACDQRVQAIMKELYTSFITPFDRNDVMDLALKMDDVVDNMKGVSTRLDLFNVSHMRSEAVQMAELTLIAAKQMHEMINRLPHYKDDPECMQIAISMGHIEDEGDSVYENGVRKLFQEEKESRPGHIVGWLRIFDRMEECLDSIDAVAGVVRSIVMKSA